MTSNASPIIFIDARVEDRDQLLSTFPAGTEVIILNRNEDGLAQIAQALEGRNDVPAIHLVSHGWSGDMWLGNSYLSAENLTDSADLLASIGARLSDSGDILLYGCNTAAGARGMDFVDSLATLTGADVAASDDRTGAGGDWQLEVSTGTIETEALAAHNYQQSLATLTVTNNSDSGAGSLRQHIADASAGDTVTFDADYSIQLSSGELVINKQLTIDGDRDDDGSADVTIDANNQSRVLNVTGGSSGNEVLLDGLTITKGLVYGDGGNYNTAGTNGLGGAINNSGHLIINHSVISNNHASGGGGGGGGGENVGGSGGSYGGGGGGGYGGQGGGSGGGSINPAGTDAGNGGGAGTGGNGGANGAAAYAGGGGTTAGGHGSLAYGLTTGGTFFNSTGGGNGGTAVINGSNIIGGGGGGWGANRPVTPAPGGDGGGAVGGIYNSGTLIINNTSMTNNAGAGGGGGSARDNGTVGTGGMGIGAIYSASGSTLKYDASLTFGSGATANAGAAGRAGDTTSTATQGEGTLGTQQDNIEAGSATVDSSYALVTNAAPTETGTFPTDITVLEDTAGDLDLSGLALADVDSTGDMTLTLTATGGTMAASDNGGVVIGGTGTGTLTLTGTVSEIDTYLNTSTFIQYTGASNDSGANAQTVAVKINDGDGSGDVALGTFNLDITAVNDAPTETGTFPTDIIVVEDTAGDLDLSGLTLADVDSSGDMTLTLTATGGTMAASTDGNVAIGGSGSGTLTLTGTVSEIDTYLNTSTFIKYTSALNENGADAQTVAVKINDGDGSGDVALGTFNLDITAVNDAPVLSGTPTLAQFEDAAAVAMDLSGVTLADVDTTGDITITVGVADTSAALSATATGTVNNVDVTQVNAYTITLAGTVSELNTYLGSEGATNITYATSTNNDNNDTLSIVANDGNSNSNSLTPVITITGINDEPTASATGDNSSAAGAGSAVSVFSSTAISAVDTSEDIASVTFTVSGLVNAGHEKLNYDGTAIDLLTDTTGLYAHTATSLISYAVAVSGSTATVTFKGPAEAAAANTVFQTALDGMTYENTLGAVTTGDRVFTLTDVQDEGGTANGGDDTLAASIASTITVVNGDTPTATTTSYNGTEDTPVDMATAGMAATIEANGTDALDFITITGLTGGTLALTGSPSATGAAGGAGMASIGALTTGSKISTADIGLINFSPTTNSTTAATVTYTVTDAGSTVSEAATITVNLAAVDDAPTLADGGASLAANEDVATAMDLSSITVADVDTTGDITLTIAVADTSASLTATGAGTTVNSVDVVQTDAYTATLTGTVAELNGYLGTQGADNLTYTTSTNGTSNDTLSITANDSNSNSTPTNLTIAVTAINDEPVVSATGTGGNSTNGVATDLFDSTAINVAVPDTGDLVTSVTFTVSGLQDGADEKINIDGSTIALTETPPGNTTAGSSLEYAISVSGSTATVVLTHAGIIEATVETVLSAMTYENTSGSFSEGARVVTITEVKDNGGTANSGDDTWSTGGITSTVTVVDGTKPTATSYPDSVDEDTPVNLSATELPTTQDIGLIDAVEYITIDTTTVTGGVLSLDSPGTADTSTVGAVAYDVTAGDLTGTVNINIADIGKLDFTPTTNLAGTGAASFNWTVTDAGGHTSPTATYTLDITNVSDDPEGTDKTVSITTSASHTFSASDFGFTDVDSGDTLNRVQVNVQTIDNGALKLSDVTVSDGDWINLVDIGNLVYTPSAAGADTFTFTVEDSTSATDLAPNTITINASAPPSSGGGGSTPTPTPDTETIDGAVVTTTETTDDSGDVLTVIHIDPVAQGREDSDATTSQADIPLHFADDAGTDVVTTISLPTGIGLAARANDTAHSRNTLDDLINLINETAGDTDSNRDDMVNSGESFLETLGGSDSTLWVNQVTLTSTGTTAPDTPIKVTGSASSSQNNFQEAMVIDTRQLPTGSLLELDDIEFAVIVGDGVTIRGGEGANTVFAGEGSQNIVLGADDDLLHGGSGDDTVGSRGGDDLLFGDAGNDTMFGGEGNDQLHGGLDGDIAIYEGNMAEYDVVQEHGVVTVSRKDDPSDTDTLINIEQIQFADQNMAPVYDSQLQSIATLYGHILGRQADLGGFQYWSATNQAHSIGQIALDFFTSDEYQQNQNIQFEQLTQADQVEHLYLGLLNRSSDAEGKAFWLNALSNGTSMEQVTESFVTSAELSPQYLEANGWNFFV